MEIAVIGWGSLIWCPGSLAIKTAWHDDGPDLPIEFARISGDCRLTLVIHTGSKEQRTYWALSDFTDLDEARRNLRQREGCCKEHICHATAGGDTCKHNESGAEHKESIAKVARWMAGKQELGGAIWTGLLSNWKDRKGKKFAAEDAVNYLTCLGEVDPQAFKRAKEYVLNAPSQIQTEVRKRLKKISRKDWSDSPLPKILFV